MVAELGSRVVLRDLYDEEAARAYDDAASIDPHEVRALRAVLRRTSGLVLELAAGSGRLTLPLLQAGRGVTALEISPAMIERLRTNAAAWPESRRSLLTVHRGDMTDFDLPEHYGAVVLLAASISLLDRDGRLRMLRTVRRHLAPGGVMLLSIGTPGDQSGADDVVDEVTGRSGQRYRIHQFREAGSNERHVGVYAVTDDPAAVVPIGLGSHRLLDPTTIRAEVAEVGLVVHREHAAASGPRSLVETFIEIGEAG